MDKNKIERFGDALYEAMVERKPIDPLTEQASEITIEDAYQVSLRMLERRTAAGERVVGKKIGVTSQAVMNMLNVHQPDFGYLTDRMMYATGAEVEASKHMIAPRAEGEIAFVLKRDLAGPGVLVEPAEECLHECMLGPNVKVDGDDLKIVNDVKGEAAARQLLGLPRDGAIVVGADGGEAEPC